jgi:hypothetical protein
MLAICRTGAKALGEITRVRREVPDPDAVRRHRPPNCRSARLGGCGDFVRIVGGIGLRLVSLAVLKATVIGRAASARKCLETDLLDNVGIKPHLALGSQQLQQHLDVLARGLAGVAPAAFPRAGRR